VLVTPPTTQDLPRVVGRDLDRRLFVDGFPATVAEGTRHRHAAVIGMNAFALHYEVGSR